MDPITVNCTIIDWCEVTAILFDTFMGACFTVLLGGIVALGVNWYRRRQFRLQEEVLLELAKLRRRGVVIRNRQPEATVLTPAQALDWYKEWHRQFRIWERGLYRTACIFSPVEAERLRTLDQITERPPSDIEPVTPEHGIALRMLSETLKRLDKMLELRFRPTQSP